MIHVVFLCIFDIIWQSFILLVEWFSNCSVQLTWKSMKVRAYPCGALVPRLFEQIQLLRSLLAGETAKQVSWSNELVSRKILEPLFELLPLCPPRTQSDYNISQNFDSFGSVSVRAAGTQRMGGGDSLLMCFWRQRIICTQVQHGTAMGCHGLKIGCP